MKIFKSKEFFLGLICSFFFLALPLLVSACCCFTGCGESYCSGTEFRASTDGREPDILRRDCHSVYDPEGGCTCVCTPETICEECGKWQKAEREGCQGRVTPWGLEKPECKCRAEYIKAPENPRYYDNPLYPLNPFDPESSKDKNNIYLPVKLDWDDVEGWIEGWQEPEAKCVKECRAGGEMCLYNYPGGCRDIVECKKDCKEECLLKIENFIWDVGDIAGARMRAERKVGKETEYRNFIPKCVRDCEKRCDDRHRSGKPGCNRQCPAPDQCFPEEEFVKSYIIEIKSEKKNREDIFAFKNCEIAREIDILERALKIGLPFDERVAARDRITDLRKRLYNPTNFTIDGSHFFGRREGNFYLHGTTADKSEFIFPPCFLSPNREYQWRVRACCKKYLNYGEARGADFDTCGTWSGWWDFETNRAPELRLPYDPDWAGSHRAKNLPKWGINYLRWCEIDDSEIYSVLGLRGVDYFPPLAFRITANYSERYTSGGEQGEEGYQCHPNFLREDGSCKTRLLIDDPRGEQVFPPAFFWDQNHTFFTKITPYEWKLKACADIKGGRCCDPGKECFSQAWRFSGENFKLEKPILTHPPDDENIPVGMPVLLNWGAPHAFSFRVEVSGFSPVKVKLNNLLLDRLELDTVYRWRVLPCWDYEAEKCQFDAWSDSYRFRTTGRPPKKETMKPSEESVFPAITFRWENVPGAKHYIFKLDPGGIERVVEENKITLDYPDILLDTNYSWKVRTCADVAAQKCGEESETVRFRVPQLSPPETIHPLPDRDLGVILLTAGELSYRFSWNPSPGAKYYIYRLEYLKVFPLEPEGERCQPGEIITKNTNSTETRLSLNCWGRYAFSVKACLGDCEFPKTGSQWSEIEFFFGPAAAPSGWRSIIPCGQPFDDPKTPWDETRRCEFRHLFLLLRNVVNFIVERLVPISLVLLLVLTGVIFYLSRGMPGTVVDLKKAWRLAGIGYGIIFLSWFAVNFILSLMGYRFGIFGHWWEIQF